MVPLVGIWGTNLTHIPVLLVAPARTPARYGLIVATVHRITAAVQFSPRVRAAVKYVHVGTTIDYSFLWRIACRRYRKALKPGIRTWY